MTQTPDLEPDEVGEGDVAAAEPAVPLPVTGHPGIDHALAALTLGPDVHTHHDQLAAVLDIVQGTLNRGSQHPLPRP